MAYRTRKNTNDAQLKRFHCALQWMRTGIPELYMLVSVLQDRMELANQFSGKRTKQAAAFVLLYFSWVRISLIQRPLNVANNLYIISVDGTCWSRAPTMRIRGWATCTPSRRGSAGIFFILTLGVGWVTTVSVCFFVCPFNHHSDAMQNPGKEVFVVFSTVKRLQGIISTLTEFYQLKDHCNNSFYFWPSISGGRFWEDIIVESVAIEGFVSSSQIRAASYWARCKCSDEPMSHWAGAPFFGWLHFSLFSPRKQGNFTAIHLHLFNVL